MHHDGTIGDSRLFFWTRIFPLFVLGGILQELGIPVFTWVLLGVVLVLFILSTLLLKTLILGLQFGPTVLSLADFIGFDLPDEYYDYKPLVRIVGKMSDAPSWIGEITEFFNR